MPPSRAIAPAAMLLALAALALSGCSGSSSDSTAPVQSYAGEPKGVDAPSYSAGGVPWAVWLKGGDEFAVTLYGTKKCPGKASGFTVQAPDEVKVDVAGDCALQYLPYTTIFHTPSNLDRAVTVQFTAQGMHFYLPPVGTKK